MVIPRVMMQQEVVRMGHPLIISEPYPMMPMGTFQDLLERDMDGDGVYEETLTYDYLYDPNSNLQNYSEDADSDGNPEMIELGTTIRQSNH